ncbi:hypothetical protein oki169_20260 [Helicobacter pylori]
MLGLLGSIGILMLVLLFIVKPGKPAIDVMLTILAVVVASATLQASGGLDVMLQIAERISRRNPVFNNTSAFLTIFCGTGHVVYTIVPIIYDIAIKIWQRVIFKKFSAGFFLLILHLSFCLI